MKERTYKITVGKLSLTVNYFADGLGVGVREPLGEIFDKISSIHSHMGYEIFFIGNGDIELLTENGSFHFSDSVVIVPPALGHCTLVSADRVFVIYVNIDRAEGENERALADRLASGVCGVELSEDEKLYLEKLVTSNSATDSYHLLSLLCSELLCRLDPDIFGDKKEDRVVGKYAFILDEYIENHYSEKITLSDVAKVLHLCEKQVTRVINKEFGCSFSEYVNRKRMSVATMMLKHTDLSVSCIARNVGFENDNYFYRVFKNRYGLTPIEYRKQKNGS